MSAVLFVVLIFASCVSSAYIGHDVAVETSDVSSTIEDIIQVVMQNSTQHILVEEVDKNGNSAIKELELVQVDESEELREDKAKVEQQKMELKQSTESKMKKKRSFDCEKFISEKQKIKCLERQKKLFVRRYKKWKKKVHDMLKAIDAEVEAVMREDSDSDSIFMPSFVTRIKGVKKAKPD